jgi:hypothetical protein
MSQLNANTPYIQCYVRKEITGLERDLEGYIFGVKSMLNYPLLFHFHSEIGAVLWNLPISAFFHKENYDVLNKKREKAYKLHHQGYGEMSNKSSDLETQQKRGTRTKIKFRED